MLYFKDFCLRILIKFGIHFSISQAILRKITGKHKLKLQIFDSDKFQRQVAIIIIL